MATGAVRRIGVSTLVRETMKSVIVGFNLGCGKFMLFRDSFCRVTLGAGRYGNSSLVDRGVRIDLRLIAMDAMAGGAGRRIGPASGSKLPMDAFRKFFGDVGMACTAGLGNVRSEDR